jgi:hypothetical protein
MPLAGLDLSREQREAIVQEAERRLASFVADDGDVRFASPAHVVSWRLRDS